ncbi:MAG: hypothetical protein KGK07_11650 [Chloroflexota bacterium]|nr:hypothetical protein [Chloroflexota bacterium]
MRQPGRAAWAQRHRSRADLTVAVLFGLLLWMCGAAVAALALAPGIGWTSAALVAAALIPAVAILVMTFLNASNIGR